MFCQIFRYLETRFLGSSRLVNRRWDEMASEVIREKHHPVKFKTTREVRFFLYTMRDRILPPFISTFCLDIDVFNRTTVLFAKEFGIHVREYNFVVGNRDQHQSELKMFLLVQHSPNIITLIVKCKSPRGWNQPGEWYGATLPIYPNLRKIVWACAI